MTIYEVNLTVTSEQVNEYSAWLEEHVREMLDLDGFESAALYARSGAGEAPGSTAGNAHRRPEGADDERTGAQEPGAQQAEAPPPERVPEGERHWTLHYHLDSREALERYFDEDADRMRSKGTDRFGDQVSAERRVLESRQVFSHQGR